MNGIFLNNVNGNVVSEEKKFTGGSKVIIVRADSYGGGKVNIEAKSANDSGAKFAVLEEFTADATKRLLNVSIGMVYRVELKDATAPSNVFVEFV